MAEYRVNARVVALKVNAGNEEEAVDRFAEAFNGSLIVVSATAMLAPKVHKHKE